MRILVVDDDITTRLILQNHLEQFGPCDTCADGVQALEQFKDSLESGRPYNIVFMDVLLPSMNGIEALLEMRRVEVQEKKPVGEFKAVVLSTVDGIETIRNAFFQAGVYDYLTKPLDRDRVSIVMQEIQGLES